MELGNLSEIIGAVAVVASVIYLALQVKKQTEEARLEASRDIASDFIQILRSVSENGEFAEILTHGISNYGGMQNPEKLRVNYFFASVFRVAEQQHLHTTRGTLDPIYFESFNRAFRGLLSNKGPREWWAKNSEIFSDEFQRFVEEVENAATH